jgi:hypothetical protein
MYKNLDTFKFWCQKILPLVYDDSLSYYEVLCKVVDYINQLIDNDKVIGEELENLKTELVTVKKWIDNFDTTYIEKIIEKYLATMIFVEISDSGYFVYYIPEQWADLTFETTGLDAEIPNTEYGRLVLIY